MKKNTEHKYKKKKQEKTDSDQLNKNNDLIKKNNIVKEKLSVVNKIFELYPNLKKDKNFILNNLFDKKENKKKTIILEKVTFPDIYFFKDKTSCLFDIDMKLIGTYIETDKYYIYFLFENIKKINEFVLNKYKEFL